MYPVKVFVSEAAAAEIVSGTGLLPCSLESSILHHQHCLLGIYSSRILKIAARTNVPNLYLYLYSFSLGLDLDTLLQPSHVCSSLIMYSDHSKLEPLIVGM
jgi:hypothetical protein